MDIIYVNLTCKFPNIIKSFENLVNSKEIKPVNPKGNQLWIFTGKTCWTWSSSTLATWCEEPTHWKRCWFLKRLRAGKEGGQSMRLLDGITDSMDMSLSKLQVMVKDRGGKPSMLSSMESQSQTWLSEQLTTTTIKFPNIIRSFTFMKASGKTWVSYAIAQLPRGRENERIKDGRGSRDRSRG